MLFVHGCRGTITVFILLIFYGAPLSVFAEVLRSRSSAALYLPFAVMNMINGMLWSAYGLVSAAGTLAFTCLYL